MLAREHGCAILELSSFQLESIKSFHPVVAMILNLTADHQDRYPDFESYLAAKTAISRNQNRQDYLLLNLDDPHLAAHGRAMGARRAAGDNLPAVLWFSVKREVSAGGSWLGSRVSYDLPTAAGGRIQGEFQAPALKLPGPHNRSNALAALLAARLQGIEEEVIVRCLENFNGIPHRLEYLGARDQVLFYNDSKATNIDAVIKAVESFDRPLLLLLGGYDKGANFNCLNPLAAHFRELIPFGSAASEISRQLPELTCGFQAAGLREALERALERAQAGDVVLLAPGCASFDEFSNYRERGDCFRSLVREAGAILADRENRRCI
ncbi:MAG: UDP-N-acetylmuramoyl-L-alanine--D-glutamate ligase [Deltaproteobacteria bacterium]|nr:UDP-N-acetylmuramoyl-L-alanine--D-glutamate ligase [Deltaproteobacteria bacterium]